MIVAVRTYRERAEHLPRALEISREIGVAVGPLMAQRRLTWERASDLLGIASQSTNHKRHDVGTDIADTGALPMVSMMCLGSQRAERSS